MKSKKILKSKKGILMLMLSLIIAVAMVVPTTMSALARVVTGERPLHPAEIHAGNFAGEFQDLTQAGIAGRELNQRVVEEGTILLKNEGGMLPFDSRFTRNISVFGKHSVGLFEIVPSSPRSEISVPNYNLFDGLRMAGFNTNPHLEAFYRNYNYVAFTNPRTAPSGMTAAQRNVTAARHRNSLLQPGALAMAMDNDVTKTDVFGSVVGSFRGFGDAALVVLTRELPGIAGAHAWHHNVNDLTRDSFIHGNDYDNHALQLIQSERDLIDFVTKHFDNVVVLLHSGHPMEVQWLEDHDGVNSILAMGVPGTDGIAAVGRILNGDVNPSGRVANMHANNSAAPSFQNVGPDNVHVGGETPNWIEPSAGAGVGPGNARINEFEEGIFTGSRYFETRGWEMGGFVPAFDDQSQADYWYNLGDWEWYDNNVTYTLGFGLSYTNFEWTDATITRTVDGNPVASNAPLSMDQEIAVRVRVTNTGFVSGADVVQLYYTTPYIANGVEKPAVALQAFQKTRVLNPRSSQVVTLNLSVRDMASWDFDNRSGMGRNPDQSWGAWVINAGDAQIRLMRNANIRSQQHVFNLEVPATVAGGVNSVGAPMPGGLRSNVDAHTGNNVQNRFTLNRDNGSFIRLSEGLRYRAYVVGQGYVGAIDDELLARRHQRGIFNSMSDHNTILSRADFGCEDLETGYIDPTLPTGTGVGQRSHPDNRNSWPRPITTAERTMSTEVHQVRTLQFRFGAVAPEANLTGAAREEAERASIHGEVSTQPWYRAASDIPNTWRQRVSTLSPEQYLAVYQQASGAHQHYGTFYHNNMPDCGFRAAIQLHQMRGVPFGDDRWVDFMNQLTLQEMVVPLISTGGWGTGSIPSIGKPRTQAADGAIGIGNFQQFTAGDSGFDRVTAPAFGTAFGCPAMIVQTWNPDVYYAIGRQIGLEGQLMHVQYLYTLVMDIRRAQLGSRVWEGGSEDPFLIGTFGMEYTLGSQNVGTAVAVKHFLAFSGTGAGQGDSRSVFMDEQTLREIYAEPFRMTITPELGGALSIMSAYGAIGLIGAFTNYALNTEVTMGEWGFQGWMMTDSQPNEVGTNASPRMMFHQEANSTLLSGNHNFMRPGQNFNNQFRWDATATRNGVANAGVMIFNPGNNIVTHKTPNTGHSHSMYYALRMSAKRVLFATVNTHVFTASTFLYKNALDAWLDRPSDLPANATWHPGVTTLNPVVQNSLGALAGNNWQGIAGISVGLTAAQQALLPAGSQATFRLAPGSTLPEGLALSADGTISNERHRLSGQDSNTGYNIGNNPSDGSYARGLRRPAESSTVPHTFQVEIMTNNMVRARKTFELPMHSTFVLGDALENGQTLYRNSVANGVPMHVPFTGLTVGQEFNGQIQGVVDNNRVPFHHRGGWGASAHQHSEYRHWYNLNATGIDTDFTVIAGSLPAGLTLGLDGSITGTPLATGQFDLTIRAHRIHRQRADPGVRIVNEVFYIHHTMVVGEGLTVEQVQAIVNAAVDNRLTAAQVQAIINEAIANRLTEEQIQALIDAALASGGGGCGSFALAESIALFTVLGVALTGLLVFVIIKNKKVKTS